MKSLRIRIVMILFVIGIVLWSCDSLINNDLAECPQGVYVSFYSMTPCATDSSFIGDVSSLTIFAFDQEGNLKASVQQENVDISRDFKVLVPVSNGIYSFIAWTGVNDNFRKSYGIPGLITRQDIMLAINSREAENIATCLNAECIRQGESPVVFLPDPSKYGSLYKNTVIKLNELTNRVKIIVAFDPVTMKGYDPQKLKVSISSSNGTLKIDGTTPHNSPVLTYTSHETTFDENEGIWNYSTLALRTCCSNNLKVVYTGNDKEEIVFDGDLIASILLKAADSGVRLDCENDFTVKFLIKDYCGECGTHFSCSVYLNDWLVHSYSSDFEI